MTLTILLTVTKRQTQEMWMQYFTPPAERGYVGGTTRSHFELFDQTRKSRSIQWKNSLIASMDNNTPATIFCKYYTEFKKKTSSSHSWRPLKKLLCIYTALNHKMRICRTKLRQTLSHWWSSVSVFSLFFFPTHYFPFPHFNCSQSNGPWH